MWLGWWKNRNSFELFGMSEHCVSYTFTFCSRAKARNDRKLLQLWCKNIFHLIFRGVQSQIKSKALRSE